MARLTSTQKTVLVYLYEEGKGRQKHDIAVAIDSTPKYTEAILTELHKRGLIQVSSHRGWWTLTDEGKAAVNLGVNVYSDSFFSQEEVNNSSLLNLISNGEWEDVHKVSLELQQDFLMYAVAMYLASKNIQLPRGTREMQKEEFDWAISRCAEIHRTIELYGHDGEGVQEFPHPVN